MQKVVFSRGRFTTVHGKFVTVSLHLVILYEVAKMFMAGNPSLVDIKYGSPIDILYDNTRSNKHIYVWELR